MPHPNGSQGNVFAANHTFQQILDFMDAGTVQFQSTTGELMSATRGIAEDGQTTLVVLRGENHVHGRICSACWGHVISCTGERVGQAAVPLDAIVP